MATSELSLPCRLQSAKGIKHYASRYPDFEQEKDKWIEERIRFARKHVGHMDYRDMRNLGVWKNGNKRSNRYFSKRRNPNIEDRTREAFLCSRIEPLLKIKGVGYPMASSLMHFAYDDKYPVIDRRVLATLGIEPEQGKQIYISKQLWKDFHNYCCEKTRHNKVSFRELDRAMWQFNAEASFWDEYDPRRSPNNIAC